MALNYQISYENPLTHYLRFVLTFETQERETVLKLPAWRPGRYQIQNFASRIKYLKAEDEQGQAIAVNKLTKDSWQLQNEPGKVSVTYEYYAFKMDAGNSWLDDEQLYINFINCAVYVDGQQDAACTIQLDLPSDYQVATGLDTIGKNHFSCPSFYRLVDSPLMASPTLRKVSYAVNDFQFYIWVQGDLPKTDTELIDDFKPFTELQIAVMGGFPCPEYHFLIQALPYKHYHGVEHWNSTVITLGPSAELADRALYKELLGVSSHELFHTWNVIRLRPREMTPYNFEGENYHETGFVTEGVTTYYGDLFLIRSGVFSQEEYVAVLNKLLKRHYDNEGRKNYSVAASSFDLWLDGYEPGIPGRKVSIYNEGALAALILDLKIRLKWNNEKSLDDVMRLMWQRHGQNLSGYTYKDYRSAAEEILGDELTAYFNETISGIRPYETELAILFKAFGLTFEETYPEKAEERDFGLRLLEQNERYFIHQLDTDSEAEKVLSLKDEILSLNGETFKGEWPDSEVVDMEINRFGRKVSVSLKKDSNSHFPIYQVSVNKTATESEKTRLEAWTGN